MRLDRRRFLVRTALVAGAACVVPVRPVRAMDEDADLEAAWLDLEKGEPHAARALLRFADSPEKAVPFFADRLRPLKADADWLDVHLKNLESEKDDVWKPAFEELEYTDPRLTRPLDVLMKEVTTTPARQRLAEILSGREAGSIGRKAVELRQHGQGKELFYNFLVDNGSFWAESRVDRLNGLEWGNPKKKWTRAARALALLEHIGTPQAAAILGDMAQGDPDAQPTRVARDALDRLKAK